MFSVRVFGAGLALHCIALHSFHISGIASVTHVHCWLFGCLSDTTFRLLVSWISALCLFFALIPLQSRVCDYLRLQYIEIMSGEVLDCVGIITWFRSKDITCMGILHNPCRLCRLQWTIGLTRTESRRGVIGCRLSPSYWCGRDHTDGAGRIHATNREWQLIRCDVF